MTDLESHLNDELLRNPFLERVQNSRSLRSVTAANPFDRNGLEAMASERENLLAQFKNYAGTKSEQVIGEEIIGCLDSDGYLRIPLIEVAHRCGASLQDVEAVLQKIQRLEPTGAGARNLAECLLLQLQPINQNHALLKRIISRHLKDIGLKRHGQIAKTLDIHPFKVEELVSEIRTLDPKPWKMDSQCPALPITPDLFLIQNRGRYIVRTNESIYPTLIVKDSIPVHFSFKSKSDLVFKELKKSAFAWISAVKMRKRTLLRVSKVIIQTQRSFFDKGPMYLKSMDYASVAKRLHIHPSTVSRAVQGKYMDTSRGLFPLKYFFVRSLKNSSRGVTPTAIKFQIQKILQRQDRIKPVSDQKMAELLKKKGIRVARRTVAKYRESLRILPSYMRKNKR